MSIVELFHREQAALGTVLSLEALIPSTFGEDHIALRAANGIVILWQSTCVRARTRRKVNLASATLPARTDRASLSFIIRVILMLLRGLHPFLLQPLEDRREHVIFQLGIDSG